MTTYYKVISADAQSQDGGQFDWTGYLPTEDGPGKWTPEVDTSLCESGYHITEHYCMWLKDGSRVFEVEHSNDLPDQSAVVGVVEKTVSKSIRLVRELVLSVDGNRNSGSWNSGNRNSGNRNSGDMNSGNMNSGSRNSGDRNSGNRNSGYMNSGDMNSGDMNSGDMNSGSDNSGSWNSGNRNSGNRNSGNRNSGYRNSGDWNSGDMNSGDWNSGGWNSCNRESGFFCSEASDTIRVFNKAVAREVWEAADVPNFFYFNLLVDGYKASWRASWDAASGEDRRKVLALPNWDNAVFLEITGIDVEKELETKELAK